MFENAKKRLGDLIESGIDAAKAGLDRLKGATNENFTDYGLDIQPAMEPLVSDKQSLTSSDTIESPSLTVSTLSEQAVTNDTVSQTSGTSLEGFQTAAGPSINKAPADKTPSIWDADGHKCYEQMGFFNYTTDPTVIGMCLDKDNRWIKLHHALFADCPDLREAEQMYYTKIKALANKTDAEKFREKLSCFKESDEVKEYSSQLVFDEVAKATAKYSQGPAVGAIAKNSKAGRKPIPFQRALGAVIVQSILGMSDRETSKYMAENPYIQYFCGYDSFSPDNRVPHSTLCDLKKVFDGELLKKINDIFIKRQLEIRLEEQKKAESEKKDKSEQDEPGKESEGSVPNKKAEPIQGETGEKENPTVPQEDTKSVVTMPASKKKETALSIDATCNPANAKYPIDFDLLNDARKATEAIIDRICKKEKVDKPRTYKKVLQKEVKDLSKKKKRTEDDIKTVIEHLLNSIERNSRYIDNLCKSTGYELSDKETLILNEIKTVYGQQKYMFENNVRSVPFRIVSLSMGFVRPIVRGKVVNKTEFGPKTEISIDENGFVRLENFEFESFNEGSRLVEALERYKTREGKYPDVVRCDKIYQTRDNRAYCKERGIRMSGPKLGRKFSDEEKLAAQLKQEQEDMVERIEVERHISRQKRCWGVDRIMERTPDRIEHAVGMAVFLDNLVPVGF